MEKGKDIFACIGPESSGKTTLVNELALHFKGVAIPEIAREYLNRKGGYYEQKDLLIIAQKQLDIEQQLFAKSNSPFFCDTDILVVMVWHQFKYKRRNTELEQLFKQQQPRKYLLTYPDLPWEADPLRESPNDLLSIFEMYEMKLKTINADFSIIKGAGKARFDCALAAVNQM